jgi:protein phosphatase
MMIADLGDLGLIADGYSRNIAHASRFRLGAQGIAFLVADGMGGAVAGALASRMSAATVYDHLRHSLSGCEPDADLFARRLRQAVETANIVVFEKARYDQTVRGMGCTATLAGVLRNQVFVAQVGDSRAYLIRSGRAVQLTRDQSLVQVLLDSGTLTEAEAATSEHSNKILQAVGAAPALQVVMTHHDVRRGDVLLLCSDGLSRVVKNDEVAEISGRQSDMAGLCKTLVTLANSRGGPDNITVIAARFLSGLAVPGSEPVRPQAYIFGEA